MEKFDAIRPFYDSEINEGILKVIDHPMMKALMCFCFPGVEDAIWKAQLKKTYSVRDFQCNFIYYGVKQVLGKSSDGLTTSGFEKLEKNTAYLYISNHRDIVLDTTLLNASLFEHGLNMTSSAIGDNLVKKPFLKILAKLNRNFLVQRGLTPREMLLSSKLLAEYMAQMLLHENRSVWIAQREGRTKDGNDETNSGVLKMIGMGSDEPNLMDYFKKIKVVPVSISYEYDPTDALKMPQLIAEANNETYIKEKNEDFMTLLSGIIGQKKRIHIHIGDVLDTEIDEIKSNFDTSNKQIQALAQVIDNSILSNYKLWTTNYIAYDIVNNSTTYSHLYTGNEKLLFERRLEMRIDHEHEVAKQGFLDMYANPVVNKLKYGNAE
ncbi:1-acyl-sn-glycerol-3-phosphate acyltransferase [Flavobacterium cellulosilyticum]|uniref:1-acyl-sn-glycerol-3-phosphate acyltransferase n=1 Tax=Flavobacterium cellulosilyticum TaxID=2541731 RepID=A0A4R5CP83_9FLAO|nr:1-acyl-sn-glycerol-3-phosphate acyltransferase [Flavobacterium cellulosilyticum]TDD99404.1 1-acyl-sn-glycerol-3-phosphate acyltransferase [Flavobacterium cellulosilyticum]